MSKICIVGAFDRYNYGDILFPIVIEKYIKDNLKEELNDFTIEFYALKDTDLTSIKGVKTKSIKYLKNDVKDGNNIIIIAGGDVLPVRIFYAYSDLIENKLINTLMSQSIRIFGTGIYDKFLINYYDLSSKFPWIIKNDDNNIKNHVYYNAVGASSIYKLPQKDLNVMKGLLEKSDYISVRDLKSEANLNNIGIKPLVYPDSAIIMSELFSDEFLLDNTTQEVKNYISKNSGYVCLQMNMYSLKGNEDRVVSEVEKLIKETNLKLVLLPIGKANNHNDLDALRIIKSKLGIDAYLPEDLNIYDVMYLIAKSNLFIGTSLHGNITAISFGVPHLGLNKNIEKLDYFLKCWDIEEIDGCINVDEINKAVQKIIKIDRKKLLIKRDELIRLANENFQNMFSIQG
ncbi:polysaccharide pyruvyl transferase family protein [Neobacillus sp. BF23-41]|uniref:polysaccharide pyruvyl transferase family protein n=1 Tax=Neobacillus sp. BF23-41 TaxID=3240280 RepID=UPI0034E3E1DC